MTSICSTQPNSAVEAAKICNLAELALARCCQDAGQSPTALALACRKQGVRDATNFAHAADLMTRMPDFASCAEDLGTLGVRHLDAVWCVVRRFQDVIDAEQVDSFDQHIQEVLVNFLEFNSVPSVKALQNHLERYLAEEMPAEFMAVESNERKRAGVRKEDDHWKLKFPRLESQRLWEKVTKIAKKDPPLKKVPLEQARMNVILRLLDGEIDDTVVHVHVYRTEDGPGFIPGVGTISVAEADRLEAFAQKVSYVDEVPDGIESYRPNQQIRDYVAGRDGTCRFPGCSEPATMCDVDHITPYGSPSGDTDPNNLQSLCRTHHTLKTQKEWAAFTPDGGVTVIWYSPTEEVLVTRPGGILKQ